MHVENAIDDVREILPHLSNDTIDELYKPQFILRRPYIRDKLSVDPFSSSLAVLTGPKDNPQVRVTLYKGGTHALSARATNVLVEFSAIANEQVTEYKLEPGNLAIINNFQTMHSRSGFKTYGDGLDCYLIRSYVLDSVWNVREEQLVSNQILQKDI